jgi:AmiR/NasT family two-component response regulator
LRVLLANETEDHLTKLAAIVESLGHCVVATSTDVAGVAELTARLQPDVALVRLGESSEHALELIQRIVKDASSPVIALLATKDTAFIDEAGRLGVFAYLVDGDAEELQSVLGITLSRFRAYHDLEGAFGRRAVIERAKGIMMERHQLSEADAFELLRARSRRTGKKIVELAQAIMDGHGILPANPVLEVLRPVAPPGLVRPTG